MRKLFFGGIHPRYNKEMSLRGKGPVAVAPREVIIPLKQHIGVECEPLVKVGDTLLKGQKIGDREGLCVPVHASVSGRVVAIEPRRHPNGEMINSVVIENDFKDTLAELNTPKELTKKTFDESDKDSILSSIRSAGIVGMGGAAFPGDVKALSAFGNINTLIANACECEPYITADDTLLRSKPEEVLKGMMILQGLLSPQKSVLAIEDNKPEAIKRLRELEEKYPEIEIRVLPTRYPQGSEKQLIKAVTGREVPPGGLPTDVNTVVFNVSTFAAIFRAVTLNAPLIERIVTVTGEGVKNPGNFIAPIGTSFEELINAAGGLKENVRVVLNGGPMMGVAQADLSAPVVKATNAILCLAEDKNATAKESPCIRCGKCANACPMHLKPLYIARYTEIKDVKELTRLNVTDCMECGCCSYVCPAKLPLTEKCKLGKEILKEVAEK